mgnify:CR=1 FL=1
MAIVKMDKFNLLSFDYNRSNLLDILQDFNYVHLNDLEVSDEEDYIKEIKNSEVLGRIDEDISKLAFLRENIKKYEDDPKKDDKETIKVLEEIINDLIADKNELIRISRSFEEELITQKISNEDIVYITENFIPVLEELFEKTASFSDDNLGDDINDIIDILKPIISVETFNIFQLLGFNFKAAIGQPLTALIKSLIESKKVDNSQIEYQKALLEHNMEYYKLVQDEEAFKRYTSLQQKEY